MFCRFLFYLSWFWVVVALPTSVFAQHVPQRQDSLTSSVETQAATYYFKALGKHLPLYSGIAYVGFAKPSKTHPFFETKDWQQATIVYAGVPYTGVPFLYDVAADEMVIGYAGEGDPFHRFVLVPSFVQRVTVGTHVFMPVADSSENREVRLYEVLHEGKLTVLAKRRKIVVEKPAEISFTPQHRLFLLKEGQLHPVKNLSSALKLMASHKRELTAFLRAQGLDFSRDRERALVALVTHYEILVP